MVPLMQPSAHGQHFLALYDTIQKVNEILYAGNVNPTLKKERSFFQRYQGKKLYDTLSNNAITLTCFTAIASSIGQFFIVDTSSTTFKFMIKGLNSTSFLY